MALLAMAAPASSGLAQAPPDRNAAAAELGRLEAERDTRERRIAALSRTAAQARAERERLQARLVAIAAERDRTEREVEASESRLRRLRGEARSAEARLRADRDSLEDVVAAMVALGQGRPPALVSLPADAADAARAALLIEESASRLSGRIRATRALMDDLQARRRAILLEDTRFAAAERKLAEARRTMGGLIADRQALERRLAGEADVERQRLNEIAARSASLSDLVAGLRALPGVAGQNPPPDAGRLKGRLIWPAAGRVTRGFGRAGGDPTTRSGTTLQVRPSAQVVAPADGRVVFSGPFRTWGQVLILDVGGGVHLVLAGLGQVAVEAGQTVLAGEPLGDMGASGGGLYLEVREGDTPTDPAPWFRPSGPSPAARAGRRATGRRRFWRALPPPS